MKKRVSNEIKDIKLKNELLQISEDDITSNFIFELFGEFNGKNRCNPYDTIEIPPNMYGNGNKKNKNSFTTTVGLWIFNKYLIEKELFDLFKYISYTIDSKAIKDMNVKLSYALIEDDITTEILDNFLEKTQVATSWITILCPNYSEDILQCSSLISNKKKQLINKYKDQLSSDSAVIAAEEIEKELLNYALEVLKDDPAMDCFRSGARGNINNNFKTMYVMKGAIHDPDPLAKQEYKVAFSNYTDGISRDEYALFAKSLSAGPYSRGKKTQLGGYWEKLLMSALQHLKIGPKDSDCNTSRYLEVYLTKDNISKYMYNFIIGNNNTLIELTSKNKDKFINKKVKMRFSSLCECKDYYCNKCVGNFLYRINSPNEIGTIFPTIASVLKNISMSAFHDSTISTVVMDPMEVFGVKK